MDQPVKHNVKLLEEIKYFSTGTLDETTISLLTDAGSKSFKYASDMITHCLVGDNPDTSAIEEVIDIFEKPVVNAHWVPLSVYANKLLPVAPFDAKLSQIFKGVIATVSQINSKDVKNLWTLLTLHGGKLKPQLDASCTHLICGKAEGNKYEEAMRHPEIIVVCPDWVVDCVVEKRLLGAETYHPSLLISNEKVSSETPQEFSKPVMTEKKPEPEIASSEEQKVVEEKPTQDTPTTATAQQTEPVTTPAQAPVSIPLANTTPHQPARNMRIASNLPPHLEQQLQQHSMMRNNVPRQQHQNAGAHTNVRVARAGAGTSWRGAAPAQPGIQRPQGMPSNEPRPATHTVRTSYIVHQVRPPNTSMPNAQGNQQQTVRQVRLVSPGVNAQQADGNAAGQSQQNQGERAMNQQQRVQLASVTQTVKVMAGPDMKQVSMQNQALPTPQNANQMTPGVNQQQTVQSTDESVQRAPQMMENTSQNQAPNTMLAPQVRVGRMPSPANINQLPQQTAVFQPQQQGMQRMPMNQPRQQAPNSMEFNAQSGPNQGMPAMNGVVNQNVGNVNQQMNNMSQQQTFHPNARPMMRPMLQGARPNAPMMQQMLPMQQQQQLIAGHQQGVMQQPVGQQQGVMHQQVGQQQMPQQQMQQMPMQQPMQQQQTMQMQQQPIQQQQQPMQGQQQQPGMPQQGQQQQQQQPGIPQQGQPQVRPLTLQQQQMLQMHIQNMSPQARQQLQQLTPQMRYVVLQRILQQQEASMQSQNQMPNQASNVPVNTPAAGPAMNAVPANQRVVAGNQQQPMGNWQNNEQQQQQPHPQQLQQQPQQQQPQMVASQMAQQTVRPFGASQILANQLNQGPKPSQVSPGQMPGEQATLAPGQVPVQHPQQVMANQAQPPQAGQPPPAAVQHPLQLQQEQACNSVNSRTKTALANLLSTRLQTAPPNQMGVQQPQQQPPQQQLGPHVMPQQQQVAPQQQPQVPNQKPMPQQFQQQQQQQQQQFQQQQQRRSLQNITNGVTPGVPNGNVPLANAPVAAAAPAKPGIAGATYPGPRLANPAQGNLNVIGSVAVRREFPTQQQQQLFGHEPGVKVAEHLCLLGCVILITDYPRTIPQDELVQWTKLMSSRGAEVETVYSSRITHLLCEYSRTPLAQQALRDGKRLVTAYWLNDTIVKQQMGPPSQILHFPSPYVDPLDRPCHKMMASLSGFEGEDRIRIRFICEAIGLKLTGHFCIQHDVLICRKPEGPKYQKAREWRKPVVTVSWLASIYFGFHQNAILQMHHPKYQQFLAAGNQQDPLKFDLNMAGNFLNAWRVPIKITPEALEKFNKLPPQLRLKRPAFVAQPAPATDNGPFRKRLKTEEDEKERSSSSVDAILEDVIKGGGSEETEKNKIMVRFSGFDSAEASKAIVKLGAGLASTNREATHLVMPSLLRTTKLLCCLPNVKYVLSVRWVQDSIQQGKLLEEEPYVFKDTELEKKMNVDLQRILALPNRNQLFKGRTFYITPSVVPSRGIVREIIENSGGKVDAQPRSMKAVVELVQKGEGAYQIIGCAADSHLLGDAVKHKIGIYTPEYVMSAVLKQSIANAPFRLES